MAVNFNLTLILRYFIGILFVFSGIAKLFPIETFELSLVSQGIAGWSVVPYLSRFIIASEIFLGLAFFQNTGLRRIFIPAAFIMLLVFSVHLLYTILTEGSKGNCGCFGQLIPMTPIEALIKNIVLLGILIFVFKKTSIPPKLNLALPAVLLVFSFAIIFIGFKIEPYEVFKPGTILLTSENDGPNQKNIAENIRKNEQTFIDTLVDQKSNNNNSSKTDFPKEDKKVNVEEIKVEQNEKKKFNKTVSPFSRFNSFNTSETVNLDEGEKIVAVLSLDCDHCMDTANKLGKLKEEIKIPPIYFLFLGEEEQLNDFFTAAESEFPYQIIAPSLFFPLIENYPPRVCYLIEGNIVGDWNYETFSKEELKKILNKFSDISAVN